MKLSTRGLQRFVEAQGTVYGTVCDELRAGRKVTHWIWFVFPQLRELGRSSIAKHFGIESEDEARAYLEHPILGRRLVECTSLVLMHTDKTAHEVFGAPDDLKFRSCMTLFARVALHEQVFRQALDVFYDGKPDDATILLLQRVAD
jgi:uncharacterized protein (DUF1810 family)